MTASPRPRERDPQVTDVQCGQCWAQPGTACQCTPEGNHVARYDRAYRRGVFTQAQVAAVFHVIGPFTNATVVKTACIASAIKAAS